MAKIKPAEKARLESTIGKAVLALMDESPALKELMIRHLTGRDEENQGSHSQDMDRLN